MKRAITPDSDDNDPNDSGANKGKRSRTILPEDDFEGEDYPIGNIHT